MSNRIDIDELSKTVMAELQEFSELTLEAVGQAVKKTSKATVHILRQTSPQGETGDYKQSWSRKRDPELKGRYRYDEVVYSKKPNYRITHLLENGHARRGGGRSVPGIPHIEPAEKMAKDMLVREFKEALNG